MTSTTILTILIAATIATIIVMSAVSYVRNRPGLFGTLMALTVMLWLYTLTLSVVAGGFHLIPESIPALIS